jgi:hypothetical protein
VKVFLQEHDRGRNSCYNSAWLMFATPVVAVSAADELAACRMDERASPLSKCSYPTPPEFGTHRNDLPLRAISPQAAVGVPVEPGEEN